MIFAEHSREEFSPAVVEPEGGEIITALILTVVLRIQFLADDSRKK